MGEGNVALLVLSHLDASAVLAQGKTDLVNIVQDDKWDREAAWALRE